MNKIILKKLNNKEIIYSNFDFEKSSALYNFVKIGKYFLNHKFILQQLYYLEKNTDSDYIIVPGYNNSFFCEI